MSSSLFVNIYLS